MAWEAAGLVARPESLMRPGMVLRVLWKSMFGPSKASRQPYGWQAPAGIEPVIADTQTPRAA